MHKDCVVTHGLSQSSTHSTPMYAVQLVCMCSQGRGSAAEALSAAYSPTLTNQGQLQEGQLFTDQWPMVALCCPLLLPAPLQLLVQHVKAELAALQQDAPESDAGKSWADILRFAEAHRDVVQRWGRFPHRNALLGRQSTPEEEAGLLDGSIPRW